MPLFVAVATFTTYSLTGHSLSVATALTSLALFEILRFPLFMFPRVINNLVEANVSINRLRSYLLSEEFSPIGKGKLVNNGVTIQSASFVYEGKRFENDDDDDDDDYAGNAIANNNIKKNSNNNDNKKDEWELQLLKSQLLDAESYINRLENGNDNDVFRQHPSSSSLSTLRRINLDVSPGDFVAVVGSVGCGKSTLLNSILGEMRVLSSGEGVSVKGKVAYAAQTPFIFNDTLRSNITFGRDRVDKGRYDEAISACALLPDLETIPNGESIKASVCLFLIFSCRPT